MRKRITSLLLTLVMLLSLVPAMGVTALAASGDGTEGNPHVVNTYEEWKAAMQQSGEFYIKLGNNIDTSTMNGGFGLGFKKLPTIKALNTEYAELLAEKKAAYADYRKSREEMKELLTAKANIDRILELDKEQEEANERREKEAEQR